jgi:amidase
MASTATQSYKDISVTARKRRDTNIAAYFQPPKVDEASLPNNLTEHALNSGYYTSEERVILESEAEEILQNVASKKWTALEVAKAFCKASAYAQELTNCVTEVLYPEAYQRAQYLDDYLAKNGKTMGPLHGLPISLKDCFITPPHPSSIGMSPYANEPTDSETVLVTMLRDLGAVFYVKTNVPTAMMMAESINHIWGETRNALHKGLTPGGSSGGEGALIALKASPLGVGTDIGGSIRIPAAFGFQYGLKPSYGRYPSWGGKTGITGQEFILAVNGPMSRSLKSLEIYSEALLSEQSAPWNRDHKCLPIPWRKNVIQPAGRKLRLGLVGNNDGLVHCHPPVERALNVTKEKLEAAGHTVIPWAPKNHDVIAKNLVAAFFDLGGSAIVDMVKPHGEPIFPSMKGYEMAAQAKEIGVTQMRQMVVKRNELQKQYLDYWMTGAPDGQPLDGIIMAVAPHAAPRLGGTQPDLYVGYTGVWNLLGKFSLTISDYR